MTDRPSRDEAQATLQAAESVSVGGSRDRTVLAAFSAGVGIAVGALLVACWWMASTGNTAGLWLSLGGYGLVLLSLFALKSVVRAVPKGFARTYQRGFVATITAYSIGVAVIFGNQKPWLPAALVAGLACLVALPSLVAAAAIARRPRP